MGNVARKLMFCLPVLGLIVIAACDNVDTTAMRETVDGNIYEIAAEGDDLRAYEWTSPELGVHCVFVAGTQKGGLFCFPRDTQYEDSLTVE